MKMRAGRHIQERRARELLECGPRIANVGAGMEPSLAEGQMLRAVLGAPGLRQLLSGRLIRDEP